MTTRTLEAGVEGIAKDEADKIYLLSKRIGDEGVGKLCDAVPEKKKNKNLKEINLWDNGITDNGAIWVTELVGKCENMQGLYLAMNDISHRGILAIADMVERSRTLKLLELRLNPLVGDKGAIRMAEALEINASLTVLDLSWCEISSIGATRIAEMVRKNSVLKTLYLSLNPIGDEGAVRMAESLEMNTSLTVLFIGGCQISDDGAIRMAEMLEKSTTLKRLDLYVNASIGDKGAMRLAEALELNTSLTRLGLQRCGITEIGAERFIQSLKINTTLTGISLKGNEGISEETCDHILSLSKTQRAHSSSCSTSSLFSTLSVSPIDSEASSSDGSASPMQPVEEKTKDHIFDLQSTTLSTQHTENEMIRKHKMLKEFRIQQSFGEHVFSLFKRFLKRVVQSLLKRFPASNCEQLK